MFVQKRIVRAVLMSVGGVALAGGVNAQTQQVEKIEITGSSIKRIEAEGALPVQVLKREDIDKSGARNVTELLQSLPVFQGFTNEGSSVGGGGAGFTGASLRNQGETRTLVLLNGKRIAPSGSQALTGAQAAVNLNNIPVAAIERVEILTDGASSLYGSDAIGGVVNFITRRDVNFVEASISHSAPAGSVGTETTVSAVAGMGDNSPNGWNFLLAASHTDRKPLRSTDRSFAKTGLFNFKEKGTEYQFVLGSPSPIPANVVVGGQLLSPAYYPSRTCPAQTFFFDTACYFDFTQYLEIFPQMSSDNVMLSGTKRFGAHTFSADFVYSNTATTSRLAPPPGSFPISPTSPLFEPIRQAALANNLPVPTGNVTARYRVADVGQRTTEDVSQLNHLSLAATGVLSGWDYNASYTRSESEYTENLRGGWVQLNPFLSALSSGKINPWVGPGQQTPEAQALLNAAQIRGKFDGGTTSIDFVDLRASRPVFKMGGGDASIAVGVNLLNEKFDKTPSLLAQGFDANGGSDTRFGDTSAIIPYSATRRSTALFAEMLIPVTKAFELSPSVRFDKYSDFGDSTNFKLAGRFQPSKQVLVRGSIGTGFKAPTVPQLNAAQQPFGVTGGTYSCNSDAALKAIAVALGADCPAGGSGAQFDVLAGGNKTLLPEETKQWTLGFRFEPTGTMSLGMDYWGVKIDNTIGQIGEDVVFGDPTRYRQSFTTFIDPATNEKLLAYLAGNVNLGKSETQGIDIDAQFKINTGFGRVNSQIIATHILKNKFEVIPGDGFLSDLGRFENGAVTHKWQARWINSLDYGRWGHTFTVRYRSGYDDEPTEVLNLTSNEFEVLSRQSKAYVTMDWQTRFKLNKNFTATLGVLNILNEDPPLSITQNGGGQMVGYDARYADSRGRTLYGTLTYRF